jgi:hypothetical protein
MGPLTYKCSKSPHFNQCGTSPHYSHLFFSTNLSLSFHSFGFPFKCKVRTKGINLIWQTVLWSIWLARNSLIFDGVRLQVTDIVEAIKYRSLKWFLARKVGVVHLSYEWEKYPLECLLR